MKMDEKGAVTAHPKGQLEPMEQTPNGDGTKGGGKSGHIAPPVPATSSAPKGHEKHMKANGFGGY